MIAQQATLELEQMLLHDDLHLFSRKVLDVISDTDDMHYFRLGIAFTSSYNQAEKDRVTQLELCHSLLNEIRTLPTLPPKAEADVLIATGIQKSYGAGKFKLGPVSVQIKRGQVYGLVGENGNGKTTLLRILAKELFADQGSITYNIPDANTTDNYNLRTHLIYIPQRTQKWYGSLLDNLKFVLANYHTPAEQIEPRVLLMVARLGLWKYKDLQWSELSSGYKMRFELARTLLRKPKIMFLDEPLANLDILSQQIILEDLKAICNSPKHPIALILSSQQLYEVEKVSDKIIFLKNGQYKDLGQENDKDIEQQLIIELDTTVTRAELLTTLQALDIIELQYNGGLYIAQFGSSTTFAHVLSTLGNKDIEVKYIRNISDSTRRFFIH